MARRQRWNTAGKFNQDDLFALQALQALPGNYLPWTGYSLRPTAMMLIANELTLYDSRFIVELGAGLSTVVIARLLRQRAAADAELVTIDDSPLWLERVRGMLSREGLEQFVTTVEARLAPWDPPATSSVGTWEFEPPTRWYATDAVHDAIGHRKIDFLLVDGPRGSNSISRYPALPELWEHMDEDSRVALDDVKRPGEQEILVRWASEYAGLSFSDGARHDLSVGSFA